MDDTSPFVDIIGGGSGSHQRQIQLTTLKLLTKEAGTSAKKFPRDPELVEAAARGCRGVVTASDGDLDGWALTPSEWSLLGGNFGLIRARVARQQKEMTGERRTGYTASYAEDP